LWGWREGRKGVANRLLVVLVVVGIAVVVVSSGSATAPGKNGQIVYAKFPRLWVISSDGTGERKLPHPKGSEDTNPDWSPNGSKLAFERCSKWCEVWTVSKDGTAPRRLGPNCLHASSACKDRGGPAWSPDGTKIAFGQASVVGGETQFAEIYVMNANGTGQRQVTHFTAGKPFTTDLFDPAWSPDGKQLVFEVRNSKKGDPPNRRALFIVNADGSDLSQLTEWSLNAGDSPDWSPDGRLILFRSVSTANRHHGNLYTIHPDGSGLNRLTNYPAPKTVLTGSFSPDGKWITFARFTEMPYPAIYVMRVNGTGVRRVTADKALYEPDWGPAA
jgi:TolB protein